MTFEYQEWTDFPLSAQNDSYGIYIQELQNNTSLRREEADLGLAEWINASSDEKFKLEHIEEIRRQLEDPALLRAFGYATIEEILGRRWSSLPENVVREQKLAGFALLNDMRTVIDTLAGTLYVADGNGYVIKTLINGSRWERFDGDPDFFDSVDWLIFDRGSAAIYISSEVGNKIYRARMDGSGRSELAGFTIPGGIGYDPTTKFLYVANTDNVDINQIVKTKIDGTVWATYGVGGSGVGEFDRPRDLSYDPATGFIYVADRNNHRIVKTKFDGTGWATLGSQGSGVNQFDNLYGIHYDPDSDFIYVGDTNNDRIVKTKIDGTGWTAFGTSGSGTNQFNAPRGITYDGKSGFVYVADYGNNRIVKVKIDGTGWEAFTGKTSEEFNSPQDIAL